MGILDLQISDGLDDVNIRHQDSPSFFSGLGELVHGTVNSVSSEWETASRFLGLAIPQGSTIDVANLIFTPSGNFSKLNVNLKIRGELSLNPPQITSYADYQSRVRTSAVSIWNDVPSWLADVETQSIDFKAVLQEIIDQSGFGWGDDIIIFVEDNGTEVSVGEFDRRMRGFENDPLKAIKIHIEYTPLSGTEEVQINTILNDAHAASNSWFDTSSDVIIGKLISAASSPYLRFENVQIPTGSVIDSCVLVLTVDIARSGNNVLSDIFFELSTNPTLITGFADYQSRVLTTGVPWDNIPAWNTIDAEEISPDLSASLQEIIDLSGWVPGQAVNILWKDGGSDSNASRSMYSYDNTPVKAARLRITYSPPPQTEDEIMRFDLVLGKDPDFSERIGRDSAFKLKA